MAEVGEALRVLSQPGDWEMRHGLRALLRHLLRDPGNLYNPLYVGPTGSPEVLAEEVHRAAEEAGVKVLATSELGNRNGRGRGVVLVSDRDAGRMARYRRGQRAGVQLVIWGRRPPHALDAEVADWIEAGIHFDPEVDGAGCEPSPLAALVTDLLQRRDGQGFAVVVVSEAAQPRALSLLRLRLDLAGEGPTGVIEPGLSEAQGAGGGAQILRLPAAAGLPGAAQAWARVLAAAGGARPLVVVTDARGEAALRALQPPEVLPDDAWWLCRLDGGGAEPEWPPLGEVLLGAPPARPRPAGVEEYPLGGSTLPELLRPAANWKPGTFLVYEAGRLGCIEVANGEIRGARRVQERTAAGTAAETVARIRDMARWPHARVLWIPRQEGEAVEEAGVGCRIPLNAALSDLVVPSGSAGFASFEQDVAEVAAELVGWGLLSEAMAVLSERARALDLGPAAHFLRAHFRAADWPQEAARLFRDVASRIASLPARDADRDLGLDAALNALLLEVRCGLRSPDAAWRLLEEAGIAGADELAGTPARVELALELAVRANRRAASLRLVAWQERRGTAGPLADRVRTPVAPLMAEPAAPPEPSPEPPLPDPASPVDAPVAPAGILPEEPAKPRLQVSG